MIIGQMLITIVMIIGHCCMNCPLGPRGPQGYPGPQGPTGETGPAGNAAALTITPLAGGTRPVSAHLVITQIQ